MAARDFRTEVWIAGSHNAQTALDALRKRLQACVPGAQIEYTLSTTEATLFVDLILPMDRTITSVENSLVLALAGEYAHYLLTHPVSGRTWINAQLAWHKMPAWNKRHGEQNG